MEIPISFVASGILPALACLPPSPIQRWSPPKSCHEFWGLGDLLFDPVLRVRRRSSDARREGARAARSAELSDDSF